MISEKLLASFQRLEDNGKYQVLVKDKDGFTEVNIKRLVEKEVRILGSVDRKYDYREHIA